MTGLRSADGGERLPPWRTFLASDDSIRDLLRACRTLVVVGAEDPETARGLSELGFRVVCVAGVDSFAALSEPVDALVVRDAEAPLDALAEAAVARGARGFWLERGVVAPRSALFAARLGLTVAMDRSILAECRMHFPDDELGYP